MQEAYSKVAKENPDIKPVNVSPAGSGFLSRFFMPRGANAVTNPFTGNISYNPEMMQSLNPQEMENTIAHELTHVKQTQNTPWWKTAMEIFMPDETVPEGAPSVLRDPYYWRPREMEAFQKERDRGITQDPRLGTYDIPLRAPRNSGRK